MAAELRLGVSFDLIYFRQQLQKLGRIAASEFTAPIKIKLDRQVVDQELNRLQKSFQRRTYTINIGDSAVSAARTRVVDLAKELANLRRAVTTAIVIPIKYETTGSAPGRGSGAVNRGVRSATASQSFVDQITDRRDLQKLYKFAKEAQLPFEQLANGGKSSAEELRRALGPAFRAVGKDAKAGLQAGLADSNSALAKAAAELGDTLLGTVKKSLGIASPSREFKKIGEDSGEGLEQGLKIGFGEASDVGVQEIEKLFKRLQKEAKAGSAVLQAIIAGSMSGIVQLPGMGQRGARGSIGPMIRQQRAQVQAERQAQAGGLSALMMGMMGGVLPMGGTPRGAGGSIGPMIRQQRAQVRARNQAQTANSAAMILGMMSGVIPMAPRGAGGSIRGLIEQERAKVHERNRPQRIAGIIEALSSASGNLSPAAGVNQRLFTGGAVNPGVLSSGYIGRSAISPKFLNYPAGMPPAYGTGFIEPTAFGSLAAGTAGRYGMTARGTQFPSSPMMTGGIGAGGGSFIPMQDVAKASGQARIALTGFTQRLKRFANFVAGEDPLPEGVNERRYATRMAAEGGLFGGQFVGRGGVAQSYGTQDYFRFPTGGMMTPEGITANEAGFRKYAIGQNAIGGQLRAPYAGRGGAIGNYAFPMSGMMGPSSPLGVINAQSSKFGQYGPSGGWFGGFHNFGGGGGNPPNQPPGGGGGGGFNFGGAANNIGNAVKNLPGKGLVREIGEEFGFAAKQVLLFGTTYKALAFLTSFPAQVGEAVGKLQSFRNTLNTISPSAEEAAQSNQFILSTVEKYNVPLDSAREGFARLYASMQPAGFGGDEIRNLFSGISKAAATFGMSADKVDRVNYAFAQMASKGQVMSEELKGQLGDVLPGAMGIFAEAAGFKGPKAIEEFGKALEDGAFKGKAMRALLNNVAIEMNKEFGPGAEGAAKTFQGAMNRMQNSTKLLYEAFEPAAVGFLNLVVVPLTTGLKQITEGFTQFFTGQKAVTEGGQALAQKLESLRPTFAGLVENAQKLAGGLGNVFTVFLGVAEAAIRFLSIPLVGSLASIYAQVQLLIGAFTLLGGRAIISAIASVVQFISSQALLLASLRASTIAMGRLSTSSLAYQTAMLQATAATQAFGSTLMTVMTRSVIGLALVAIGALIARIAQLRGQLGDISGDAKQMLDSVKMSAKHGLVDDTKEGIGNLKDRLKTYKDIKNQLDKVTLKGSGGSTFSDRGAINTAGEVSSALAKQLVALGVLQSTELTKSAGGYTILEARLQEVKQLVDQNITAFGQAANASGKFLDVAQKNKTKQSVIQRQDVKSLMGGGDGKDKKDKKERESQVPQLQLRLELSKKLFDIDMRLAEARLKENTALETELELVRKLTELDYQRREVLLENIPDNEKALKIEELKLQRQQAILASQLKLRLDLNSQYMKSQDALTKIIDAQIEETSYAKKYQELVLSGVNPALAKTTVEVTKRFAEEARSLDTQIQQLEVSIATAETTIELLKLKETLSGTEKEQLDNAQKNLEIFREHLRLRKQAKGEVPDAVQRTITETQAAEARSPFGVTVAEGYDKAKQSLEDLTDPANVLVSAANSIGDAFGKAFTDIAIGAQSWQEGLGNAFKSVANMFADMVAQMLAKWAFMQIVGMFLPGAGSFAGGTKLGGSVAMPSSVGIGAGGGILQNTGGQGFGTFGPNFGIRQFATGGLVTGPTLGLVGEGRFNEAVVPLPNGKSIPVDLGQGAGNNISTNIVVNMSNGQSNSQMSGRGGQALGREIEGAVRNVILKETRPGGLIYSAR